MRFLITGLLSLLLSCLLHANELKDTLKVGYTSAPPFIMVDAEEPYGAAIWLWKKVSKELEIPYELVPMEFSAMLDSLSAGSIDVSINPLTITSERMTDISFTLPFYSSNSTIAVKTSSGLAQLKNFLAAIFNLNFIRVVAGLLFLIGIFGFAVWFFERKKNPEHFRKGPKGIWDGLWWSAVTMTTVGYGDKAPKSRGGKLIALIWMFSGLIFISGFTASIASILTVYNLSTEINDLNDFKERKVGTIESTGTLQFLKYNFFKDISTYPVLTDGLHALENGDIEAFIYDQPILNFRIKENQEDNQLKLLPTQFNSQFYSFGIAEKNNTLREGISLALTSQIESIEWRIVLAEYELDDR